MSRVPQQPPCIPLVKDVLGKGHPADSSNPKAKTTMNFSLKFALTTLVLIVGSASVTLSETRKPSQPAADLVFVHGKVWTVDQHATRTEALAISGGRIAAVGTDTAIMKLVGPETRVVDAHGKTVLPGFIDAHVHFEHGGLALSGVQLRDAATPQEFVRRIAEYAKRIPKGEWILAGNWDQELWPGRPLPTRNGSIP